MRMLSLLASLLLASCLSWVSGFDEVSYRNLTDLKAETLIRLERCVEHKGATVADLPSYDALYIQTAKAREYELGKKANSDTAAQLAILTGEVKQIGDRLRAKSSLSETYCELKAKSVRKAFDIAISTEAGKQRR
ncbi:MAG: hypothetical protein V4709_10950 [Pseudomonadota bacterium]